MCLAHMQTVTCMAYDAGTLYVGLDSGSVHIYSYIESPKGNPKIRFEVWTLLCFKWSAASVEHQGITT
jgi:hypothetical protein